MNSSDTRRIPPILAFLVALICTAPCAATKPIPPVPLRQLAANADVIALVRVETVDLEDRHVEPTPEAAAIAPKKKGQPGQVNPKADNAPPPGRRKTPSHVYLFWRS